MGGGGTVDDFFLRLVSFSIFENKKTHGARACVVHMQHRLVCICCLLCLVPGQRSGWVVTHGVVQGRSLLWLSRHEKSDKIHWICPRAVRRVQATSSMLLCSFWSVGRGQYENTSRMCCGIRIVEVEEETCSARAKEAFHQQICVFKGKPASKMVRVSQ